MQQMVILNYILRKSVGRLVGVVCALRRAQRRAKRAANCRRKIFYSPAQFDLHPHNSSYTPAQKMQATRTERRPKKRQSPPEFAPAQFFTHPHRKSYQKRQSPPEFAPAQHELYPHNFSPPYSFLITFVIGGIRLKFWRNNVLYWRNKVTRGIRRQ